MKTREQRENSATTSFAAKELQDVRQVINIFFLAWKNYSLYPEDHITTIKSFEKLIAAFGNYFMTHGDLRLTVEKDSLLCESEVIREVSPEAPTEDIISLLYRDGVKWIEFQEGLTLGEVATFFRIAHKYKSFAEETEGDIVTALMDEELEHIDFKAVDIFWQDLLLMDFSRLASPAPPSEEVADKKATNQSPQPADFDGVDIYARSIADPSISDTQLNLSHSDYEILHQMVKEEERWEITEDLFELLLIILKRQTDPEKFAEVLGFISEEVVAIFALHKFDLLVNLFQSLHKFFAPETLPGEDWKRPLIDRFFQDLSNSENFRIISENLLMLETSEIVKLKALSQLLHYFSPAIIPFLVPVIMLRSAPEIQQMVSEVIVYLSQRDMRPLEKIAEKHGAEMGDKLLVILHHLQGERVNNILFKMCEHSSDKVRRKAIKELVDRDPEYVPRLFSFIDDPSKEIRTFILAAFAKHKSSALENMLLNYLKANFAPRDPAHILACYKALGRCGSKAAVPFLRKILLLRGWNSFMGSGKLLFREGAAIALALIDTPEAKEALRKASKSRFKVIRQAFDRSMAISDVSGETSNG